MIIVTNTANAGSIYDYPASAINGAVKIVGNSTSPIMYVRLPDPSTVSDGATIEISQASGLRQFTDSTSGQSYATNPTLQIIVAKYSDDGGYVGSATHLIGLHGNIRYGKCTNAQNVPFWTVLSISQYPYQIGY